uniref:Uncharacterized protein n=1 Tax=Arundo donax TaxID=35708 RepID=A0A0A9B3T6_ARUDO
MAKEDGNTKEPGSTSILGTLKRQRPNDSFNSCGLESWIFFLQHLKMMHQKALHQRRFLLHCRR